MEKLKQLTFTRAAFILLFFSILIIGCSKSKVGPDTQEPEPTGKLLITETVVPATITADPTTEVKISGKGFTQGDVIILTSTTNTSQQYNATVKEVAIGSTTFIIPGGLVAGSYKVTVKRGNESLFLGTMTIELIFNASIPNVSGMTIKGSVHAQGVGLANVVVSDGIEVTKTDSKGIYYLASKKANGYVFISIPGNYEVDNDKSAPLFYKRLMLPTAQVEVKDFKLTPVDNNKHVVMVMTDLHLANRNNDVSQFERGFLQDVNNTIQSFKSGGTKVYGLTLGDLTWETYWYSGKFFLSDYLLQMNKINAPVFNTIGNHDNDPYIANDILSETQYRNIIGPTYYSFNLGKVHYVILDNVEYLNAGASIGVSGSRDYNGKITNAQMEWLKKDLAMIEDKSTPIVVGMHIQLHNSPTLNVSGQPSSVYRLINSADFIDTFSAFNSVNVLTGHTHVNYKVENSTGTFMEHNTGAVCATWWWTGRDGYAGNHIATDGSPGGYSIWEFDNKDIKWQFKGIGEDKNYQFRAYDLNKVLVTAADHAPRSTQEKLTALVKDYITPNNANQVLINVWGFDQSWKVEVTENGKSLPVTRLNTIDPLHVISYSAKRIDDGATSLQFPSTRTAHMFRVNASNATNTLEIKVTDRFQRVYTETMTRPKAFTYSMK